MKLIAAVLVWVVLCVGAWSIGSVLSSDAIGMVLGLLFGILVPLPGCFLVLVAARRQQARRDPFYPPPVYQPPPPPAALLPPPTIIVVQLPSGQRVRAQVIEGQRRLDD